MLDFFCMFSLLFWRFYFSLRNFQFFQFAQEQEFFRTSSLMSKKEREKVCLVIWWPSITLLFLIDALLVVNLRQAMIIWHVHNYSYISKQTISGKLFQYYVMRWIDHNLSFHLVYYFTGLVHIKMWYFQLFNLYVGGICA